MGVSYRRLLHHSRDIKFYMEAIMQKIGQNQNVARPVHHASVEDLVEMRSQPGHVAGLDHVKIPFFPKRIGYLDHRVARVGDRSEEHTPELQSRLHLVCPLLLFKKTRPNPGTSSCRSLPASPRSDPASRST